MADALRTKRTTCPIDVTQSEARYQTRAADHRTKSCSLHPAAGTRHHHTHAVCMTHMEAESGLAGMGLGPVGRVQGLVPFRDWAGWGMAEPGRGCTHRKGVGTAAVVVQGTAVTSTEGRGENTGRGGADTRAAEA